MKKILNIIIVSFALVFSTSSFANKIGVIYDSGGKFDKSFNELAYKTALRVQDELGWEMVEFEAANNTQIEQGMRKVADRGATLIVGMGFAQADAVAAVAPDYPDIKFVAVDVCWLEDPAANIYQACYKEHEGSFLVGMMAAMKSETGKVGFVGGMDIPLIRKFQGGYEQGAKYINPDIEVFANMTGTTVEAWNNPTKGAELTKALMEQGVTICDPTRIDIRGTLKCGDDVYIDVNTVFEGDVELSNGVTVRPFTSISNSYIGENTEIKAYSTIDNSKIGNDCIIGPYARLRPGSDLKNESRVGNFVEIKKSTIGERSKVPHLTYVGDTTVGTDSNIGAGTITCNYDGANKHNTQIGDNVFIGSGVELVAPVLIEDGATIGAGSTISKSAPKGKLTLERAKQKTVDGWQRPSKSKDKK